MAQIEKVHRGFAVGLLAAFLMWAAGVRAHDPVPFPILGDCAPGGPFVNCWVPVEGVEPGVPDNVDAFVSDHDDGGVPDDLSLNTPPLPHLDLFNGEFADLTTIFYAYSPELDMFYFRMRLLETPVRPTSGSNPDFPQGYDARGPFLANSAWNFIVEVNGDGWSDYLAQVDGNEGTNQSPNDHFRLAFNDSTTTQQIANVDDCLLTPGGRILEDHRSNVIANVVDNGDTPPDDTGASLADCSFADIDIDGDGNNEGDEDGSGTFTAGDGVVCVFTGFPSPYDSTTLSFEGFLVTHGGTPGLNLQVGGCRDIDPSPGGDNRPDLDASCNFAYVRITNNVQSTCDPATDALCDNDFFLDMQMPLGWFDTCEASDADGDGIGGAQFMTPTTPFTICATTSVQPNDFVQKDVAFNGAFAMSRTTELPCGGPCTLSGGCDPTPVLLDTEISCTGSTGPVTLTALILDALVSNDGTTIDDTQLDVEFFYKLASDQSPWAPVVAVPPSTNPVLAPTGLLNEWSVDWDTSGLDDATYLIRIEVVDSQGHVTDTSPVTIDTGSCSEGTNPVSLSSFVATRTGGGVEFEWSTETEAGNVGFNLYQRTARGWRRLNDELIASRVVDAAAPQSYTYSAGGAGGSEFAIEDVDLTGTSRFHGGFAIGHHHGRVATREAIDWGTIAKASPGLERHRAKVQTSRKAGQTAVLSVERDGIYRLTHEDLLAAGIDLSGASANHLALVSDGESIPLRVVGPKRFGPGSLVEFVGRARPTLYSNANAYTLSVNASQARRIAVDRSPLKSGDTPEFYSHAETVERNLGYAFSSPSGDPWYDTQMLAFANQPRAFEFDFEVGDYVDGAAPARLRVAMWGATSWPQRPDHHVVVTVNGSQVADAWFDGLRNHPLELELPAGVLHEGVNTLTLSMPGDTGVQFDLVYYDHLEITYPRAFDAIDGALEFAAGGDRLEVTGLPDADVVVYRLGPDGPRLIQNVAIIGDGSSYAAVFPGTGEPSTYRVATGPGLLVPRIEVAPPATDITSGSADYLIISHGAFTSGLAPLIGLRESEGLVVKVVDVADVYAQFGGGVFGADGIRNYIRHAASNMGVRYVLLVGGDTYDYHDYLGVGSLSFIPSLYDATSFFVSFSPSDALYTDLDGDRVPDLPIGRFPVRTLAELEAAVDKTVAYAAKDYQRTAIFTADKRDNNLGVSFADNSDELIALLAGGWTVDRAYLDQVPIGDARDRLLGAIDAGVALASFVGHSGPTVWTFSNLLSTGDVTQMTNAGRPTVVVQAGCWNTYYVSPHSQALGSNLLLAEDRGAAAVLGSATLSAPDADQELGRLLVPLLTRPGVRIGDALTGAKQGLAVHRPDALEVLLGVNLLGDPALIVDP